MIIQEISDKIGISEDKLLYVISLYSGFPFAIILQKMLLKKVHTNVLHLFSCTIGILALILLFGWKSIHPISLVLINYLLLCTRMKKIGLTSMIYSMSHLTLCHLFRMINSESGHLLDVSTPMMMLVQHVTLVSINVEEAYEKKEENSIIPSFLEYLGYCFFFPTVLVGPSIDYLQYKKAISGFWVKNYKENNKGKYPSILKPTLKPFLYNISCFTIYVVIFKYVNLYEFIASSKLNLFSFSYVLLYYMIYILGFRSMYYGCWKLVESQCNLCYMGFGGLLPNGKEDWSQCKNVNVRKFELATNTKVAFDNWNILTSHWLRKTVYERVSKHKVLLTFGVSAIWHGFYPHYYYVFIIGSLLTHISRLGRNRIRPYFMGNSIRKCIYDVITSSLRAIVTFYHMCPFMLLDFRLSFILFKKLYFIGHIALILGLLMEFIPKKAAA